MLSPVEDRLSIPENGRIENQARAMGIVSAYYKLFEEEAKRLSDAPIIVYGGQGEVIPPRLDGNRYLKYNNSQTTFINTVATRGGHKVSIPVH